MDHHRDPTAVARELVDRLGLDAVVHATEQVELSRRSADRAGVTFWQAVGRHVRKLAAEIPPATPNAVGERALWRLMQRIEHFRHQARICEVRAAQGPAAVRSDLLEIARHWRELAAYAEVLTETAVEDGE